MADLGGRFIWAISFIGLFSVLVGTIPAIFLYSGTEYEETVYSDQWRAAQLFFGISNTTSIPHDNDTITRAYPYNMGELYIEEHDVYVEWHWEDPLLGGYEAEWISLTEWWYWSWLVFQFTDEDVIHLRKYDDDDLVTRARILANTLESNENLSSFEGYTLRTKHEYYILFSFNETTYANFTDAWDNGELNLWVGINPATTESPIIAKASMNAWSLIGQLLTFQAPDLLAPGTLGIILNALIAIPLWAVISYVAFSLFMKLVHGGD